MESNLFDLTGRVALVTGTSRGLGQYFARALAKAGADLIITSRDPATLKLFQQEMEALGRQVLPLALDVRNQESIQSMVRDAAAHFGRIDILVNNAGCNVRKPALDVSWDEWNLVLDTNLRGTFFVSQAVARHMISKKYGRIINIGSVTCVAGYAGLGPYGASRGGVKQLTMSLADDWGSHGITVNCLAPGWFKTSQNAVMYQDQEWVDYLCDRIPLKRPGQPNDLDGAIVFLASDASGYVTAQTLLIDGGISGGATRAIAKKKQQ
ncbi:MAG TPA: glucose 1-dehydrogenase [Verrucomicrobiae bacterium]|jgi:gluconate 5-dehydrogenase|nr:glucose 1-dehydrogenase [Verrucomicrobiae bacterium]